MKTNQISPLDASKMKGELALLAEEIMRLKHQLEWFKRQIFGQKSEKQLFDNPHQTPLFGSADVAPKEPLPSVDVKPHKRKSNTQRKGDEINDTGLRFDDSVPQKLIELSIPELDGVNADQYEIIGYKDTTRLAQQPGSYVVLIYRRPVVRHKIKQTVGTLPAPSAVFEGCYADVSVIAGLMVDKAVYHLPLYRQHQRMLDSGVTLSRATLINWMVKGIELLRPIYQAQFDHIIQSKVLAMDEVPIKAGRKGKGKMKQTYFWPIYGEQDEVAFTWSSSRGLSHAKAQLKGFNGTLLTDGYPVYTKAVAQLNQEDQKITHAACWVHMRRNFEKSLTMEPEAAQWALGQIALLYQHEKHIREQQLSADETHDYRLTHSEPLVRAFFNELHQLRQNVELLPSNPLSKAIAYATERETQLKVFLANPCVPMDTNHLERALRVIPMGRKNYLFCWSELGAEQLGILQSLMVTCRMQGINPYHYLVDVLQRVALHPASQVEDLTPLNWKTKFARNFLTSDLAILG
jgi:transposase